MRVISKARLRQFWELPGCEAAEGPLRAWYSHVNHRSVDWRSWSDVKTDFASARVVGNCVVFNIGGNKYRLVTHVRFPSRKVFILKVMTHAQYNDGKGKQECGCLAPPPKRKRVAIAPKSSKKSKRSK
jgi:mRNA interferase HigB